jgi:hypothetical protein
MNREELTIRYNDIKELSKQGYSSRTIGERYSISGARIRWILLHPPSSRRYTTGKYPILRSVNDYRLRVIEALGARCSRCGYDTDIRALQIDHIQGGGCIDRKVTGNIYIRMMESIEQGETGKYQVLCANCNWIKKQENREYRQSNH